MAEHPHTPDGRYFVVRGRLWRLSDPGLAEAERQGLVRSLMAARRAVRDAKSDPDRLAEARSAVDAAKRALGERGPVWWTDGAPDLNRKMVVNTPYAAWFESLARRTRRDRPTGRLFPLRVPPARASDDEVETRAEP